MIPFKNRFHGRNSLRYIFAHGKTVRSGSIAVRYVENPKNKSYRCAVVVSKKVSKSAVVRNRIRRRIYELVREQEEHLAKPVDLVVTVYSDQVASQSAAELKTMFNALLVQAGVLK